MRVVWWQILGWLAIGWMAFPTGWAQSSSVSIVLGPAQVAQNQAYAITLRSSQGIQSHDPFPNLNGFTKRSKSSSSSTTISNGRVTSEHRLIQYYAPQRQGTFKQPAFSMRINGQVAQAPAFVVAVVAPVPVQNKPVWSSRDPASFFNNAPQTFIDVKDDAFLALTPDKKTAYLGEGVHVVLGFYVSTANQAPLQFYKLSEQLTQLVKKFKPAACWEENFNIQEITKESVVINGKPYARYKLHEATYYPLRLEPMYFPSVGLKMLKYKVAQQPSFFGRNRQEDFKTFYTRPRSVDIQELPPHPLRDAVAVGQYRLSEEISKTDLTTGEGFTYAYIISGTGNISGIPAPSQRLDPALTLYAPEIRQQINRSGNTIYGSKRFTYYGSLQQAGTYPFSNQIEWIYFDPVRVRYDTLLASVTLVARGENIGNQQIATQVQSNLYAALEDPRLLNEKKTNPWYWWGGVLGLVTLGIAGWLLRKN